jgi:hypothetical protein
MLFSPAYQKIQIVKNLGAENGLGYFVSAGLSRSTR